MLAASNVTPADAAEPVPPEGFAIVDDSYSDTLERAVRVKQLRNMKTGEMVEVLLNTPGYDENNPVVSKNRSTGSGSINGLYLISKVNGEIREVQPHRRGFAGGLMAPFANRINHGRYTFQEHDYQLTLNWSEERSRMSRSGTHAIHGLLPEELHVASWTTTDSNATLTMEAHFDGSDPGYPWKLDLSFVYTLDNDGFRIDVQATNSTASSCP